MLRVSVTYLIFEAGTNVMKWPPAFVLDEFMAGWYLASNLCRNVMSGLPEGVRGGAGWLPALCGGPCLAGLTLSSFYCSISSLCTQCGAADCVLIFLGASACTAPKFYIFTEANLCVLSLVQCAAQHRHQTILNVCSKLSFTPSIVYTAFSPQWPVFGGCKPRYV